jgi:outer membrane protein assembly factor BamB
LRRSEELDKNNDQRLTNDEYGQSSVLTAVASYLGNRDGIVTQDEWKSWSDFAMGGEHLAMVALHPESEVPAVRPREVWKHERGYKSVIPSPLAYGGILYVIKNGGILTAFDITTGQVLKMGRVTGAVGGFSASPVAADGKVFLPNEDGKVAVVRADKEWEVLAVNELDEAIYATPALSEGRIYLRTSEALYAFGAH